MICALLWCHVFRSIWKPRVEESLQIKPEYAIVHDPFVIAITASLQETLTAYGLVGHLSRRIFRFCQYFLNYGGLLVGRVRDVRYRRALILEDELEIPITMVLKKHKTLPAVFNRMREHILEYTEPENIKNHKSKMR